MDDALHATVGALLRRAAADHLLPRWRQLESHQVEEKSPGELVTIVDREVEAMLGPALQRLRPASRVVGEEAVAAEPQRLRGLDQGEVWLVDPLDGTANFIAGKPSVAMMVALLRDGEALAGWMLDPIADVLYHAELGGGAWADDRRLWTTLGDPQALRAVVKTRYLPPALREAAEARLPLLAAVHSGAQCAGADYPAVVAGESDAVLYWRTLPWDHVPGVLFVQEAGGVAARLDGSPYRVGDDRFGLLVARDAACWKAARQVLEVLPDA